MIKTSADWEKEILENLKKETGGEYKDWKGKINKSGFKKRNDIVKWLKEKHNFKHTQAEIIAGIYLNNDKLVYQSQSDLKNAQFENKEALKPLYEYIEKTICSTAKDVQAVAKKTYMSFTGKREFAAVSIKSKEIRVAMDLGNMPFDSYLQKATSIGAMPRLSHMVKISNKSDIDNKLKDYLEKAYSRVNK